MKVVATSIQERAERFGRLKWSEELTPVQIEKLARFLLVYSVAQEDTVFQEGEDACYLAFISKGSIRIEKKGAPGEQPQRIAILKTGDIFGEMALIDGQPRSATACAHEDAELLFLTADNFALLRTEFSLIGMKVLFWIAKGMSQRLRLTNDWLIDALNHSCDPAIYHGQSLEAPPPNPLPSLADPILTPGAPQSSSRDLVAELEALKRRVEALEQKAGTEFDFTNGEG